MKLNPYLNFNGHTEEAFHFYQSVFGGEFDNIMRYKDVPPGEQKMPEGEENKIMHISLPIGDGQVLMGSDISEALGHRLTMGNSNYISITPDSVEEGRKLYDKLSIGGKIEMKYSKMFWGDYFASFADKYGIYWMINVADKK